MKRRWRRLIGGQYTVRCRNHITNSRNRISSTTLHAFTGLRGLVAPRNDRFSRRLIGCKTLRNRLDNISVSNNWDALPDSDNEPTVDMISDCEMKRNQIGII